MNRIVTCILCMLLMLGMAYGQSFSTEINGVDIKIEKVNIWEGTADYAPNEGNVFLMFHLNIHNNAYYPVKFNSAAASAVCDGIPVSPDRKAEGAIYECGESQFPLIDIGQDCNVKGVWCIQVPRDWVKVSLVLPIRLDNNSFDVDEAKIIIKHSQLRASKKSK